MSFFQKLRSWLLRSTPVTAEERRGVGEAMLARLDELPPFSLATADLMRFDPQVRIGLGARNGLLATAQAEVVGGSPEVAEWVAGQWERIWKGSAALLLKAKLYGFVPFEVMYREARAPRWAGAVEFDRLVDRHPRNCRVLMRGGQIAGCAIRRGAAEIPLYAPKALVCTFDAEFGNPYGCALLARAYPAWHEKWMAGGAKKTLRLRMIKDAYLGDIFWYPVDRKVSLPSGETVSWRDLAREMIEARLSGGALTLPLVYDRDGRKLIDYTPPQDVGGGTHIFEWKREVDLEIWKALELPPEIIEASRTGSGFSGRSIPFLVALGAVQSEFDEIVRSVDRDVLRPLAQLNFGRVPEYELRPRSLVETFAAENSNLAAVVARPLSTPAN